MARNEQLVRQHRILQILEYRRTGCTTEELRDELVKELGLSSLHWRSVHRDLAALQKAGIDVGQHHSMRGKIWKLGPKFRHAVKIAATATELIALSLSRDLLYPLAGTPFWQGIESFWHKLQEEMPAAVWKHYEEYRHVLFVRGMPAKSYEKQHGILSTLHRAILEHRVAEVEYEPPGKDAKKRRIEPYAVIFYQSSLYIIAATQDAPAGEERVRHFKLDRFHRAVALDEWFPPPKDFRLEDYVGRGLGIFSGSKARDYRIRLSAKAARWVTEDPWHADQKVEPQVDGSVILTVHAAHELEIIPRVLALGTDAEVLSPASCRKALAAIVEELARKYPGS
ncbi:MAG TPA: WYL domain-containing protein [Pirellulaceae bacterium]|nr:WYL domain-containing protein [Pirellulaceae bacterium]